MASTGDRSRRALLGALAAAPALLALSGRSAEATDYGSAGEVFEAIDRLEAEVAERLRLLGRRLPAARPFEASVLADQARHRAVRLDLRRRLGIALAVQNESVGAPSESLPALREVQERLVHAHAEGLPALGDSFAVARLVDALVDLARHLAVIDLWLEAEESRG